MQSPDVYFMAGHGCSSSIYNKHHNVFKVPANITIVFLNSTSVQSSSSYNFPFIKLLYTKQKELFDYIFDLNNYVKNYDSRFKESYRHPDFFKRFPIYVSENYLCNMEMYPPGSVCPNQSIAIPSTITNEINQISFTGFEKIDNLNFNFIDNKFNITLDHDKFYKGSSLDKLEYMNTIIEASKIKSGLIFVSSCRVISVPKLPKALNDLRIKNYFGTNRLDIGCSNKKKIYELFDIFKKEHIELYIGYLQKKIDDSKQDTISSEKKSNVRKASDDIEHDNLENDHLLNIYKNVFDTMRNGIEYDLSIESNAYDYIKKSFTLSDNYYCDDSFGKRLYTFLTENNVDKKITVNFKEYIVSYTSNASNNYIIPNIKFLTQLTTDRQNVVIGDTILALICRVYLKIYNLPNSNFTKPPAYYLDKILEIFHEHESKTQTSDDIVGIILNGSLSGGSIEKYKIQKYLQKIKYLKLNI